MQEEFSLVQYLGPHAVTLLAIAGTGWKVANYVNTLKGRIAKLESDVKANETRDAERDDTLRREFDEKLNHQKELAVQALSKHEQKDEAILSELKDHKTSCQREFDKIDGNFRRVFEKLDGKG